MSLYQNKNARSGILWLSIICLTGIVFSPNISAFFHSDDLDLLWFVKRSSLYEVWRNSPTDYFRPLVSLELWAEWHLWGAHPLGYHLTHCFVHVINCALVFQIGNALGFSRKSSSAAGLLFLMLPGHSEAVAWIADNFGIFTTLFTLLAIRCFFLMRQGSPVWGAWMILCGVMALLSKEAALFLPVIVVLFDRMRPQNEPNKNNPWILVLFSLLPLYLLARWCYLGSFLGGPAGGPHISAGLLAWGLARALPAALCPMTTTTGAFILASALFVGLGVWQIRRAEGVVRRDILYLLLIFYTAVLPGVWTSLSPPLWGYDTRMLYLPSAFACLALVRLVEKERLALLVFTSLFAVYCVQSFLIFQQWQRAGVWVRQGIDTVAALPPCRRRIVLVSPDIRYPAYVFRRGLDSGTKLMISNPPEETKTLDLVAFYSDNDLVELKTDSDRRGVIVLLRYAVRPIKRTPAIDASTGAAVPLQSANPPAFHLTLPDARNGDQFVYFSRGRFHYWSP